MNYAQLDMKASAGFGYVPGPQPLAWALDYPNIPVVTSELVRLGQWYPVCFARGETGVEMVLPAGPAPGHSMLINNQTGLWIGRTMPFYLRRFPFAVGYQTASEGHLLHFLSLAQRPEVQLSADAPQPVIALDGSLTDRAKAMIKRLVRHDKIRALDAKRIKFLDELGLFVPHEIDFGDLPEGLTAPAHLKIDEAALMRLEGEAVAQLHALKAWRMIYGHLFSIRLTGAPKKFQARLAQRQAQMVEKSQDVFDILDEDDGLIEF
ncbi:MAG: SapC family protein [Pseudomonadota bacterium]